MQRAFYVAVSSPSATLHRRRPSPMMRRVTSEARRQACEARQRRQNGIKIAAYGVESPAEAMTIIARPASLGDV